MSRKNKLNILKIYMKKKKVKELERMHNIKLIF